MKDICIKKVDESYLRLEFSEQGTLEDVYDHFSFLIKNHRFDPRVKSGKWNGIKHLFDRRKQLLESGLLMDLLELCEKRKYSFDIDPNLLDKESISIDDIKEIVHDVIKPKNSNGELIEPYDYQYAAVQYQLSMNRTVSIAATSAGKSLIAYLTLRIYQLLDDNASKKMLLVVPTKNLVEQMYKDFKEYSQDTEWVIERHVQRVNSDYTKFLDKNIIITTWQSAQKFDQDILDDVAVLFVDEVHGSDAQVLNTIIKRCRNTKYKHGVTGTLDDWLCHEMTIKAAFGPIKKFVSAKDLIDSGRATKVKVNMILLNHSEDDCKTLSQLVGKAKDKDKYLTEAKFISSLKSRQRLLYDMFLAADGNTLVLFDLVEDYGQPLYEGFKELYEHTHLIIGDVKIDERQDIKQILETSDQKQVLFASFKTMSVGESIKNLHNLFIVSSKRSKIAILQALGRLMRLHHSKSHANLYDIIDNLTYKDKRNFSYNHSFDRLNHYDKENHELNFIKIDLK